MTTPVVPGAPVTPTPAAAPTVPATPGAAPAAAAPQADAVAELAKLEQARRTLALEKRQGIAAAKKLDEQRAQLAADKTEVAQIRKLQAQARLNPRAFLQSIYGDKYKDVVLEADLNGTPTADVVQLEIQKLKDEFEEKLATRDTKAKEAELVAVKTAAQKARADFVTECGDFLKASEVDFPALTARWSTEQIATGLAQYIEAEFNRTAKFGPDGVMVAPGTVLTKKEAAEKLEAIEVDSAAKIAKADKYAAKFRPAAPATKDPAGPSIGGPKLQRTEQRRTLSNDLTASTSGRAPPVTPAEKRERAVAAFNQVHSKAPA